MYGARYTNETAVDASLSQQAAGVAMPGRSCSWIMSSPLQGAVGTRLRISDCFAEPTTAFTLDNALERYISQQNSPSSGRALLAPEIQRARRMRPIRKRIAGEETDRAARECPESGAVRSRRTRPISGQGCSARPRFRGNVRADDELRRHLKGA